MEKVTTSAPSDMPVMQGIKLCKWFGRVAALEDVDITLERGEVVGLVGDNGAGKSTLIKILSGVYRPDSGELRFEGQRVEMDSPRDARRLGIETVYQDLALVETMSIARNFFLGAEPQRRIGLFNLLDTGKMLQATEEMLRDIGITVRSAHQEVSTLSGGERQAIAIGRTMHFGGKILILDEPTSALSVHIQTPHVALMITGKYNTIILHHVISGISYSFVAYKFLSMSSFAVFMLIHRMLRSIACGIPGLGSRPRVQHLPRKTYIPCRATPHGTNTFWNRRSLMAIYLVYKFAAYGCGNTNTKGRNRRRD
jgi:ABC-type branched-subunit amino acid transport system ATPase component